MASPANGSSTVSHDDKNGVFTVADSVDQPKLKNYGRAKRMFSIRRHLQKHGLAHANSDSDLENEESESLIHLKS